MGKLRLLILSSSAFWAQCKQMSKAEMKMINDQALVHGETLNCKGRRHQAPFIRKDIYLLLAPPACFHCSWKLKMMNMQEEKLSCWTDSHNAWQDFACEKNRGLNQWQEINLSTLLLICKKVTSLKGSLNKQVVSRATARTTVTHRLLFQKEHRKSRFS